MTSIVGILLAAGKSSRFGSRKLLHPLPEGMPIGLVSAKHLAQSVDRAVAVIPPGDAALMRLLALAGLEAIPCAASSDGIGANLAYGVKACAAADGWVVALADMPFIQPATIAAIVSALKDGAPLAAPVHDGRRGHPVGFDRAYYGELAALSGDSGARHILERDRSRIHLIPVPDPGIHRDIDTPADLD